MVSNLLMRSPTGSLRARFRHGGRPAGGRTDIAHTDDERCAGLSTITPARPGALRTRPPEAGHLARPRRARRFHGGPLGAPLNPHAVLTMVPGCPRSRRLH